MEIRKPPVEVLNKIIKNLKHGKATEPDKIYNDMINNEKQEMRDGMYSLMKDIWRLEKCPKIGNIVTLVFQKKIFRDVKITDKLHYSIHKHTKYSLSIFKVFITIVAYKFINIQGGINIRRNTQHDFRCGKSASDALHVITQITQRHRTLGKR